MEELYAKVNVFDTLLDPVRTTDDKSVAKVVKLIRNGASLDEIDQHARGTLQSAGTSQALERTSNTVMSIAALVDEPPIHVPATPWTTVTEDDDFVSHLISMYFTWHHESYPCIDKDLFVRKMTDENTTSRFCSPFLANCILLTACVSQTVLGIIGTDQIATQ